MQKVQFHTASQVLSHFELLMWDCRVPSMLLIQYSLWTLRDAASAVAAYSCCMPTALAAWACRLVMFISPGVKQ